MSNPNPSPETRFKPGGPPGPGRPRSRPLTDRIRERLEAAVPGNRTEADLVVDRWLDMIRDHDASALRELLNRIEGKVTQGLEHTGDVTIRVEYGDDDDPAPETPPGSEADQA